MGNFLTKKILRLSCAGIIAIFLAGMPNAAKCATCLDPSKMFGLGERPTMQKAPAGIQKMSVKLLIKIPANYSILSYDLNIPEESTVGQAVEAVARVEHGLVCCDSRDIKAINGLANDPYRNAWWTIKVNGNSQNYSSHSHLLPGDVVELAYSAKPISHQALRDWLLSFSKGK